MSQPGFRRLRQAVGLFGAALIDDGKLGRLPWLPGPPQIPPESATERHKTTANVEVPTGLSGDLCIPALLDQGVNRFTGRQAKTGKREAKKYYDTKEGWHFHFSGD